MVSKVIVSENEVTRQQVEEDLQLYGSRPAPPEAVDLDESNKLANLPPKRNASEFAAAVDRPVKARKIGESQAFNYEAVTAMDWNCGASPLDAWLNQSAVPSTAPDVVSPCHLDSPAKDLVAREVEEIKVFRNVHVAIAHSLKEDEAVVDEFEGVEFGAQIYCRNIRDRYPLLPTYLTRRLAQANFKRSEGLRSKREELKQLVIVDESPSHYIQSGEDFYRRLNQLRGRVEELQAIQLHGAPPMPTTKKTLWCEIRFLREIYCKCRNRMRNPNFNAREEFWEPYFRSKSSTFSSTFSGALAESRPLRISEVQALAVFVEREVCDFSKDYAHIIHHQWEIHESTKSLNKLFKHNNDIRKMYAMIEEIRNLRSELRAMADVVMIYQRSQDPIVVANETEDSELNLIEKPIHQKSSVTDIALDGLDPLGQPRSDSLTEADHKSIHYGEDDRMSPRIPNSNDVQGSIAIQTSHQSLSSNFWTGDSPSPSPESSMNSSLHGRPTFDPREQNPIFPADSQSGSSASLAMPPALPPPPVELGKVLNFDCDICGQNVKVQRRLEWQ